MSAFETANEHKTKFTLIPFNKVDRVSLYKSSQSGYELSISSQGEKYFINDENADKLYSQYRDWVGRE